VQGVALVSSSVSLPHLRVIFHCKTLLYINLNKNYNILYLEYLIYGLYVCTCVFLLHQEYFDMILVNNSSFYDGGVTLYCLAQASSDWRLPFGFISVNTLRCVKFVPLFYMLYLVFL
jgi:hypothetical protein